MGERLSPALFVTLILLTAVVFLTMLVMNAFAGNPAISRGLFHNGIGNISRKYELPITPAGWTFSIWGVIYFLQLGWIVYAVSNICRSVNGSPAYLSPAVLGPSFFIFFIINNLSNILWLFAWDREHIVQAAPVLGITTMSSWVGLVIGYTGLNTYKEDLVEEGRKVEIALIKIFVFNGLGMYGAWTTIATCLNIGSGWGYVVKPTLDLETVSLVCLGIIAGCFIVFFILDLTVLERYSSSTLSPYATLLWALAGIAGKNWDPEQASSIVVAVLGGVGVVSLVLKVVVSYWRRRKQPQPYRRLKVWATLGNEVYPSLSTK